MPPRSSASALITKPVAVGPNAFWILSPKKDLALFILVPSWILILAWLLKSHVNINEMGAIILAFGAMGHHLPGFIRAYTDPILFRQYRWRFVFAPLFFLIVCGLFAHYNFHGLQLILVLWGAWHGAMQVNGFSRIYDSKIGAFAPATAWLDWSMCLVWFTGGILHSPGKMVNLFVGFYQSGGPLIPPNVFSTFRLSWDVLTVIITAVFLANARLQFKKGTPSSPVKYLAFASAIGFWWFCMIATKSLLVGVILFEIFHDVQYNALVWVYNQRRVVSGETSSPVERFFFRPNLWRIGCYIAVIMIYGYIGILTDYANITVPRFLGVAMGSQFWAQLVIASGFLHFYYDGFIWRVRDVTFREKIGIENRLKNPVMTIPIQVRSWRPALKWTFFLVPVTFLWISEYRGHFSSMLARYQNMAEAIPQSWYAHFVLATLEQGEKNLRQATIHFQRTLILKPDLEEAHIMLADIFDKSGNKDSALAHYTQAIVLNPLDYQALNHLGKILQEQHQIPAAIDRLRRAVMLDTGNLDYRKDLDSAMTVEKDSEF
jgi:hypothetical protein